MAVTFDAVGSGIPNASYGLTPQACTLTPSLASGLLVLTWISFLHVAANRTLAGMLLGATYGASNQPMIELGRQGNGTATSPSGGVALFGLLNPNDTGAQTVNTTCTADGSTAMDEWWANTTSYLGAAGVGAAVLNGGTATTGTTGAVTSAVGDMVAALIGHRNVAVVSTSGTARYTQSGTGAIESGVIQDAPGAASVTITQTATAAPYAAIAVDIQAAVSISKNRNISRQAVQRASLY